MTDGLRYRRRVIGPYTAHTGKSTGPYLYFNGEFAGDGTDSSGDGLPITTYHALEEVTDEKHPISHLSKRKYASDIGGPFSLRRLEYSRKLLTRSVKQSYSILDGAIQYRDAGSSGLTYVTGNSGFGPPAEISYAELLENFNLLTFPTSDLAAYGPTAFHKFSPLKSSASSLQGLVELYHDGFPKLIGELERSLFKFAKSNVRLISEKGIRHNLGTSSRRAARTAKRAGKDYLNYQFGWLPLISDLKQFYTTWTTISDRLDQVYRDNGKAIRRRGNLVHDVSSTHDLVTGLGIQVYPRMFNETYGTVNGPETPEQVAFNVTSVTTTDVWFSGQFRYFLPEPKLGNKWSPLLVSNLFGSTPDPALIYQLMPWSWLIDWFSNVGDVISNISSNFEQNLVLDYGYLMRHVKTVTTYDATVYGGSYIGPVLDPSIYPGTASPRPSTITTVTAETKQRIVASPFGFGLQFDDLSVRQKAILGALGLSRLKLS